MVLTMEAAPALEKSRYVSSGAGSNQSFVAILTRLPSSLHMPLQSSLSFSSEGSTRLSRAEVPEQNPGHLNKLQSMSDHDLAIFEAIVFGDLPPTNNE